MMKIIFVNIAILAVLAGMCISCQDEMSESQAGGGFVSQLKINATITDPATKVAYAESDNHDFIPSWEVGDKLLGFDSDGVTYGFEVSSVDDEGVAEIKIITTGEYAGTATADPADGTEMYMFYAPGAVKDSLHADKKEFTVSIKEQSSDIIPALMMAQGTVESGAVTLHFTNETSIIAIKTPKMATPGRKYTSISIFGTGVNTEVKFSVDGEGVLKAEPVSPGRINKVIDVNSDAEGKINDVIYIVSSPVSETSKLTFLADNGEYLVEDNKTLAKGNYYYMTSPSFNPVPADVIPGGFSTKDANGVISIIFFSKGNLYATDGTGNTWNLEDKQYDFRTYAGKKGCIKGAVSSTKTPSESWGTFCFSTTNSESYGGRRILNNEDDTLSVITTDPFKDWGELVDNTGKWCTLSSAQWKWIVGPLTLMIHNQECRESSTVNGVPDARWMRCQLKKDTNTLSGNYIHGVMLFPDVFKWPTVSGAPAESTATCINEHYKTYKDGPTYTYAQFATLESAGAVFLPMEGMRRTDGDKVTVNSGTYGSNSTGYYWTSSESDTWESKAVAFYQIEKAGFGQGEILRNFGLFVRLVTTAK